MDNNLRNKAFNAGLKQCIALKYDRNIERLAQDSGYSFSYLSEIKTGKKPGSIKAQKKIAEACGYNLDKFIDMGLKLINKSDENVIDKKPILRGDQEAIDMKDQTISTMSKIIERMQSKIDELETELKKQKGASHPMDDEAASL